MPATPDTAIFSAIFFPGKCGMMVSSYSGWEGHPHDGSCRMFFDY